MEVVGIVMGKGIKVLSEKGEEVVPWELLMQGHELITDTQTFQIGVYCGMHITSEAANDAVY